MADQRDLLDGVEAVRAYARWTDPETSHAAADSLDADTITAIQGRVLAVLRAARAAIDVEWIATYRDRYGWIGSSTLRTRRSELVALGLVEDSGDRRVLASGRRSIVWRVTVLADGLGGE